MPVPPQIAADKYCLGFLIVLGTLELSYFFIIPALVLEARVQLSPFINLSRPEDVGLNATRNFYFQTAPEVTVGAWHILPEVLGSEVSSSGDEAEYMRLLQNGSPIILYLHGSAESREWGEESVTDSKLESRALHHRVELYKVLSKAGFHVLALDYRGFGDSSGFPSEEGVTEDAISAFKWIRRHSSKSAIFIWGHSLGSAVATGAAKRLNEAGEHFDGLILESPFNNLADAVFNHPRATPFKVFPWLSWILTDAIKRANISFASDENIAGVTAKTLILHSLDDKIIPHELARKLYDAALQTKKGSVEFVTFDGKYNYGHIHIHLAPDLPYIIREFAAPPAAKGDQCSHVELYS